MMLAIFIIVTVKMYRYFNMNPAQLDTGDCVVRAISLLLNQSWERTYLMVALQGFLLYQMPATNDVWSQYLYGRGFRRRAIKNSCPDCYTVKKFCEDFPIGRYLLALNGHVVAVIDGSYYDTWDSGDETVLYYWRKEY